jgi:hypothetical protein
MSQIHYVLNNADNCVACGHIMSCWTVDLKHKKTSMSATEQTELRDQHASNSSSFNSSSSSIQHPASLNKAYKNTLAILCWIPLTVRVRQWSISSPEERNGESRRWSFDYNEESSNKKQEQRMTFRLDCTKY